MNGTEQREHGTRTAQLSARLDDLAVVLEAIDSRVVELARLTQQLIDQAHERYVVLDRRAEALEREHETTMALFARMT